MKFLFLLYLLLLSTNSLCFAQNGENEGKLYGPYGGEQYHSREYPLSKMQHEMIQQKIRESQKRLGLDFAAARDHPLFTWPLKPSSNFNDPSYWMISNYVDQSNYPNRGKVHYFKILIAFF